MGYQGLLSILRTNAEEEADARESEQVSPQACPNDGEPLVSGPDGAPYCPFDGWRPDGLPGPGTC